MIINNKGLHYFKLIESKTLQGMVKFCSKTPYWVDNDSVIKSYECIREVWHKGMCVNKAISRFNITRSTFYDIEDRFVKYGLPGLYQNYQGVNQFPDLEKLVLYIKKCRSSLSYTAILRIVQAVPVTKSDANCTLISDILNSHGYGLSSTEKDRDFWQRIQRTVEEHNRLLNFSIKGRDKRSREATFFNDSDPYHKRLELFREVFFDKRNIKQSCAKFNVPAASFYRMAKEYVQYGPWAILPASLPGCKETISKELQLEVIISKLRHPKWSAQQVVNTLKLKCSRFVVNRVIKRWGLEDKERSPVSLEEYIGKTTSVVQEFKPIEPIINSCSEEKILSTRRINRHFELICKRMKTHKYHICDPGPLLMAPLINDLGIVQAFESYGPARLRGKEITNLALLNIMRIIAGYSCVKHLSNNKDRSVAFASGVGLFGSSSKFYEESIDFTFEQLHNLRCDLVARAVDMGIISGKKIGFDFHFKEFYGKCSYEKGIGKGPDKSGNLVAGFRPHVAWDLAKNVIISIAYYQGATRAPRIIKQYCEENIFSVLDRLKIEEIYMDSEYTKEGDIHYFNEIACKHGDVYICLKKNPQIKKLVVPSLKEDEGWQPHGNDDERKTLNVNLPKTGLALTIVVLRNNNAKEFKGNNIRCFGSTNSDINGEEILKKYRYRWIIENGLKDLVYSYFADEIYGADPQKIEFEFYSIMVARLAYEYFLNELGGKFLNKEDGYKNTLSTMRQLLFEKHNCTIEQDATDNILLTFLDPVSSDLKNQLISLYKKLTESGKNKVLWWQNKSLILDFKNQFAI